MGKYIFICAAGHSGSTLLDLLLGAHSKIASLGEITQLPKNIALKTECMCGHAVDKCVLWKDVIYSLGKEMGVNLFKNPYALNLGFINASVIVDKHHQTRVYNLKRTFYRALAYADLVGGFSLFECIKNPIDQGFYNNFKLYDTVMNLRHLEYVVDSSKDYLKGVKLYLKEPRKVKLILLIRDGRGVFYSNIKRGRSKRESLMPWLNQNKRALTLIKRYIPANGFIVVKYEDLATSPELTLRRICDFIELEYESTMLDFMRVSHHVLNGNNMRFRSSSKIHLDEVWKDNLSSSDLQYFTKIGGATNRALGYKTTLN